MVSSKFVAISEGRVVDLHSVVPSEYATELAKCYNLMPTRKGTGIALASWEANS